MKEKLGAKALPVQCPIGAESEFAGMVDLVTMKAIVFHDESLGTKWDELKFLPNSQNQCQEMRHGYFLKSLATIDED